jgi:cbb3-type cytochrome oxidase maturation protein
MEILYLLVPLSVALVFVIGAIFWWFLKSGQFEDLEGPGYRILMDDDRPDSVTSNPDSVTNFQTGVSGLDPDQETPRES